MAGKVCRSLGCLQGFGNVVACRAFLRESSKSQRGLSHDGVEEVIEVVGYTSRKSSDAFQLLRVTQSFFRALAFSDVFFHRDEVGNDVVRVLNGRDGSYFPKELSVLFFVVELAAPVVARCDGFPQPLIFFRRGLARFQNVWFFPAGFIQGITRYLRKLGVDIFNDAMRVRDDDGGGALFNGKGELTELFLRLLAFRYVMDDRKETLLAVQHDRRGMYFHNAHIAVCKPV